MEPTLLSEIPPDKLEETISRVEADLGYMNSYLKYLPAPCLLCTFDDRVAWANKTMLNLFFGTLGKPEYVRPTAVVGRYLKDLLPAYLYEYVTKQNHIVFGTNKSQYERWVDDHVPDIKWICLRFPVNNLKYVGVILFPEDPRNLALCDAALNQRPASART